MAIIRAVSAAALACALAAVPITVHADASDAQIAAITDEGLNRSEIMVNATQLFDGIGPRLTNSDNFYKAADWATAKMAAYGLHSVHVEPWHFGLGWNLEAYSARMVAPRPIELRVIPVAWSPPTGGVIRAPVIVAPMARAEHFAAWHGKLAGKIVLVSLPGTSGEPTKPVFQRLEDKDLADHDKYDLPKYDDDDIAKFVKRTSFAKKLTDFLKAEGALAMVKISYRDGQLVQGEGYATEPGQTLAVPSYEMGAEDYRRLVRLAQAGMTPTLELETRASFNDKRLDSENIFGEIPGSDAKAGYVMAGAHFDSWIAGDGAADNGAGSLVVLEAARILARLGVHPKRTIRFALWSGEEQGLLGSRAFVEKYLATRPVDPAMPGMASMAAWTHAYPITPRPSYGELKAYFNLDNGSGKIRGIYAENDVAAVPLLKKWLAPFATMGAGNVVIGRTGGTDHVFMQAVGVPGFEFIQDPLDYGSRVHHSNLDTVDHLRGDDLRQAATVMAAMLLQAADSDTVLPRPPLPTQPTPTDPYKIKDPDD
jgi:hypothetical protein